MKQFIDRLTTQVGGVIPQRSLALRMEMFGHWWVEPS